MRSRTSVSGWPAMAPGPIKGQASEDQGGDQAFGEESALLSSHRGCRLLGESGILDIRL